MTIIDLVEKHGFLCTKYEDISDDVLRKYSDDEPQILVLRYDEGDCDTIKADDPNLGNLIRACFDARETGQIPSDTRAVRLPNGTEILIDQPLLADVPELCSCGRAKDPLASQCSICKEGG